MPAAAITEVRMKKADSARNPGVEESMEAGKSISFVGVDAIDHTSPVPLYFQLSRFIARKIEEREWVPGQLLPSEQEICSSLNISRTVVRQAIGELERDGLVVKRNGKKSSIAVPKYQGSLMHDLRGFFEDAVAKGQKPYTQVLSLKVIPAAPDVANALALSSGQEVVELNRLRFLDEEPEVLVLTYLPDKLCPNLSKENFRDQSLYQLLDQRYGIQIVKASRTIEAIALDKPDAKLLRQPVGSPALLMRSIGLLADGTPCEYFIAKHRGDRAKFDVELIRESRPVK